MNKKLAEMEESILSLPKPLNFSPDSDIDLSESSDLEIMSEKPVCEGTITETSTPDTSRTHPHFGGKTPKNHAPPCCINIKCKNEKEAKDREIKELKLKVDKLQEELIGK